MWPHFLMICWTRTVRLQTFFDTLVTKSIGHRQVFLFSHLTYLVHLLYLGKLPRPKYQQKLNKIIKISQEDVILIENLYLSKQYGARRLLNKLLDKGRKVGSIDSQLKRSYKTGTIVPQPGSGRPRLSHGSGGPCAVRRKAKKASVSSLDFAWNCHSLFKCTQKNILPWFLAHMLQTMSCSAVVRS